MIRLQQFIVTDQERRGSGTERDPYREVLQVYTPDGQLVAERDPNATTALELELAEYKEIANTQFEILEAYIERGDDDNTGAGGRPTATHTRRELGDCDYVESDSRLSEATPGSQKE